MYNAKIVFQSGHVEKISNLTRIYPIKFVASDKKDDNIDDNIPLAGDENRVTGPSRTIMASGLTHKHYRFYYGNPEVSTRIFHVSEIDHIEITLLK